MIKELSILVNGKVNKKNFAPFIGSYEDMFASITSVVPMQLLSYHVAKMRGCDIDKPRNLAKSVTVE